MNILNSGNFRKFMHIPASGIQNLKKDSRVSQKYLFFLGGGSNYGMVSSIFLYW